jgi:hypothetical protein
VTADTRSARAVAWSAFIGGTLASVAANVAHARITPAGAPADWHPVLGPQIAAAFWPLALLAAIEVITRVPWPAGWVWTLARYAGTGTVAAGAAMLSYRHMAALLTSWGEDSWNAHVGPLVVDGLMVVAGTALLAMSKVRPAAEPVTEQVDELPAATETTAPIDLALSDEPEPQPAPTTPAKRNPRADDAATREAARAAYRAAVAKDAPMTGAILGAMFDRSASWGRARIAEATKDRAPALVAVK